LLYLWFIPPRTVIVRSGLPLFHYRGEDRNQHLDGRDQWAEIPFCYWW